MNKKDFVFYLFAIAVFFIIISPFLLSKGMCLDGIIYAQFAKNFANGSGTFTQPFFSDTFMVGFKSHPPMFFFLEGIFMKIFGTSFLVERFFSLLNFIITGFLMVKTCQRLELKYSFPALLFVAIIPRFIWCLPNNLMENCLIVFTTLSVLLYLCSLNKHRIIFLVLAGLSLSIGFSLKGFVALFPYSFPFIYWLIARKHSFGKMAGDSLLLVVSSILPVLLSICCYEPLRDYFITYFNVQYVGSLTNVVNVDSRFYILESFLKLKGIAPVAIICAILAIIARYRMGKNPFYSKTNNQTAIIFLLFSLTAVLPVMISLKQSDFYILAAYPFVAIAAAAFMNKGIGNIIDDLKRQKILFPLFKVFTLALFAGSIVLCSHFYGKYCRDKSLLQDIEKLSYIVPENTLVYVPDQMRKEYYIPAYSARMYNIFICFDPEKSEYMFITKELEFDLDLSQYQKLPAEFNDYFLFKRDKIR